MAKLSLDLTDKPNLQKLMKENPEAAREVMRTFAVMMEHAVANGWHTLPQQFHPDLTFFQLIHDILHGLLDLKDIDPEFYEDMGAQVHPLGLFSYKVPDPESGQETFYDWQTHFHVTDKDKLPPIQSILRRLMYYARYIKFEDLSKAMLNGDTFLYTVERDPSSFIALQPALRWQREHLGELSVGQFWETIGFLKGGSLKEALEKTPAEEGQCPACRVIDDRLFKSIGNYKACLKCGIAYEN